MENYVNKIICADSLEFMKGLPDKSIDLVVTSPPYNKGKQKSGFNNWKSLEGINYDCYSDDMEDSEYIEWQIKIISECLRVLKDSGSIFYNTKAILKNHLLSFQLEWLNQFGIVQLIFWLRGGAVNVNPVRFIPNTEQIYWIAKQAGKHKFNSNSFSFGEVWKTNFESNTEHPAPFPLDIPKRCIEACTDKGDIVLDPFNGSGTTCLAAEMLGRKWIGIDLSEKYCAIAEKRLDLYKRQGKLEFE